MQIRKLILYLTKKLDDSHLDIDNICSKQNILLSRIYKISDMIDAVTVYNYEVLIIDYSQFPVDDDLLSLFNKRNYYVPKVILLSDNPIKLENKSIVVVKKGDFKSLEKAIAIAFSTISSPGSNPSNTFFHTSIVKELINLGFSLKYKGFKYLADIIYKIIINENMSRSFKKYAYPYIASLYSVSEDSVERDVRNILTLTYKKHSLKEKINFNEELFRPTTRNLVNGLTAYIKFRSVT